MAFDDLQRARTKNVAEEFIERKRPPENIRSEIDLGYDIDRDDQSVQIFEIRPDWRDPEDVMRTPIAKVKYVKSRDIWALYWIGSDGKWDAYQPAPEVRSLERALVVVEEDELGCFWG